MRVRCHMGITRHGSNVLRAERRRARGRVGCEDGGVSEATPAPDGARRVPDAAAGEVRALAALDASGLRYRIARHAPVRSLAEAAAARQLRPEQLIKTLVVRRAEDDFLFVLVPGGRTISWPKLRALLGVARLSMPDADVARQVTGYERGTITPFGATTALPVIADARVAGRFGLSPETPARSRPRPSRRVR